MEKDVVAKAIHSSSERTGDLVNVNCAAIPSELLESELFGHEKVHLLVLTQDAREDLNLPIMVHYF